VYLLSCSRCCVPKREMVPLDCGTIFPPLISSVLCVAVDSSLNPVITKYVGHVTERATFVPIVTVMVCNKTQEGVRYSI